MREGFDPHRISVWLIEGFLPYLSESAVLRLLDKVTALSAPGSRLGFTAINRDVLTSPSTRFLAKFMEEAGIPWFSAFGAPQSFLAKHRRGPPVGQARGESANIASLDPSVL